MLLHKMFSKAKLRRVGVQPDLRLIQGAERNDVRDALIVVLIEASAVLPSLPALRRQKLERAIACLSSTEVPEPETTKQNH